MFERLKIDIIRRLNDFDFRLNHSSDPYDLSDVLASFREDLDNLQARTDRLVGEVERGE